MNNRVLALIAAFTATSIYGINHTIGKELMPYYIGAFGLILLRVLGASILFWLIGIWGPKERIDLKDWKRLFLCSLAGMSINMLAFFKGLSLSTPINSSIIITLAPIMVFVMSVIFIKEKITKRKYTLGRSKVKKTVSFIQRSFAMFNRLVAGIAFSLIAASAFAQNTPVPGSSESSQPIISCR